jgi:hypothetical protein
MKPRTDDLSLLRYRLRKILVDQCGMPHAQDLKINDQELVQLIESKLYSLSLATEFLEREYKKLRREHNRIAQEQFAFLRKEEMK